MEVRIRLLPPAYLGRRMQYALLSLTGLARDEDRLSQALLSGEARLDWREYRQAVERAVDLITMALREEPRECRGPVVLGVECCSVNGGPTLYTSGANDRKTLEAAGLARCHTLRQRRRGGEALIIGWSHAALSYAALVMEGSSEAVSGYDLPMLAKASLFSRTRGYTGAWEARQFKVGLHELGSTLLGGAIAFLGRQRLSEGGDQRSSVEFLLLPDRPSREYEVLVRLSSLGGLRGNLAARAARLARHGVSLEAAVSLAFSVMATEYSERLEELDPGLVAGAARLYMVGAGQRPQIRGGLPITLLFLEAYSRSTLRMLYSLAAQGTGAIRDSAVGCVNKLFLQAQAGAVGDYIVDCARSLAGALASLKGKEASSTQASIAGSLLARLEREYSRIAGGPWG